jgi:hypothetical protein
MVFSNSARAAAAETYQDSSPQWLTALRDAYYASLPVEQAEPLYRTAKARAEASLSGAGLYTALSACEYYMGRIYQDFKAADDEALEQYFQAGYDNAQKSLDAKETAQGWRWLGANLSQLCTVKSVGWVMSNGLDVARHAKKALALDPKLAAAQFLICARWVYGPGILGRPTKGIEQLTAMLNGDYVMEKSDLFDVYTGMAYAWLRKDNNQKAAEWMVKALTLYPTNRYVGEELKGMLK